MIHRPALGAAVLLAGLATAPGARATAKHEAPVPGATTALMASRDMAPAAPILMRAFKKEAEIEVWKKTASGRYQHLKTFPICRWSGQLGPKLRTGDRQTPEGFYAVAAGQMNPNSSYYLSFNLGYPNAYDRAQGATGSHLMVHGTCSSMGCFAMTDGQVSELYALARDALAGGQAAFQFQSFPFRMTAANMARYRQDPHIGFWRQLKEGSDRFEATGEEPTVVVAGGRYTFAPHRLEAREKLAQARITDEQAKIASLVEDGRAAVRTTYADGGMHPSFAPLMRTSFASLGSVSRPEALAAAGREIVVIPARIKVPETLLAALPPPRPTAPNPSATEPSLFSPRQTSLGSLAGVVPTALIPGAAAILPAQFAPPRIAVATAEP